MALRVGLAASMLVFACGCAGAAGSPEQSEGYVLLDRAARDEMVLVHDGWEGTPVLPTALDLAEPASLKKRDGTVVPVEIEPGMLLYVHGEGGEVELLELGGDVRGDRLLVHGSDAAVADLATQLAASRSPRGDGLWTLAASDLFERTSFLETGEGILEATPDRWLGGGDLDAQALSGASAGADSALFGPDRGGEDDDSAAEPGRREAWLVGVYRSGASSLLLDAAGRFSMEDPCTGAVRMEGHYYAMEGRVVLRAKGAAPVAFAIDGEALIHPEGERLVALETFPVAGVRGGKP